MTEMTRKRYPNRLGIIGWLQGGRRGVEGYLYLLHRITGIALLLFLVAHVFFTTARLFGQDVWERLMTLAHTPLFQFIEYLVYIAFVFHALNGVRLLLVELGLVIGRPDQPVFPYKGSVHKQRPLMIALMILSGLLIVLGGFELLRFSH